MLVKLEKIVNAIQPLGKIASQDLPIKISYQISKLVKLFNEELKTYKESYEKIFNEYAITDENGEKIIEKNTENFEKFQNDLQELNNIENDMNIEPIDINDLTNINISPFDLEKIDFILK